MSSLASIKNSLIDVWEMVDEFEKPVLNDYQRDSIRNAIVAIDNPYVSLDKKTTEFFSVVNNNINMRQSLKNLMEFSYTIDREED